MPSAARGPLPAHVYKRRRLVVISVAVLLVFGFGRVLSWSSDGSGGGDDKATQAAADTSPSAAETTKKGEGKKDCKGKNKFRDGDRSKGKRKACQGTASDPAPTPTPTPTPPAVPSGPCPDADVFVTPAVPDPVAGRDVAIVLNLQMGVTEACTWRVSPDTVTVNVYAGADDVWFSRECPGSHPDPGRGDPPRRRDPGHDGLELPAVRPVLHGPDGLGAAGPLRRRGGGARGRADRRRVRAQGARSPRWSRRPPSRRSSRTRPGHATSRTGSHWVGGARMGAMSTTITHWAAGARFDGTSDRWAEVTNPASGLVTGRVALASRRTPTT